MKVYKHRAGFIPKIDTDNLSIEIFKRDLKSLSSNELYASHKDNLNDPTECFINLNASHQYLDNLEKAVIELFLYGDTAKIPENIKRYLLSDGRSYPVSTTHQEKLRNLLISHNHRDALKEICPSCVQAIDNSRKNIPSLYNKINNFGICSLTMTPVNELMWAHYSSGHLGFAIEYDLNKLVQEDNSQILGMISVNYSENIPIFDPNELFIRPKTSIEKEQHEADFIEKFIATKSLSWEYEQEIRIFSEKPGLFSYDQDALSGIYFGVRMHEELEEKIKNSLHGRNVDFYKMKHLVNSYELYPEKI